MKSARRDEMKLKKALRFIEELSWLLKSHQGVDIALLAQAIEDRRQPGLFNHPERISNYLSSDRNTTALVGILPKMFMNSDWFASNADIAEFAQSALGLRIPRWEKISKIEMIGHVVCRVAVREGRDHAPLVAVLEEIFADQSKERSVADMRKHQISWNEIIRRFG